MTVQSNYSTSATQDAYQQKIKTKKTCNFEGCAKSLKLVDQVIQCRCNEVFCRKHRDVIAHHCMTPSPLSAATRKSKLVFEGAVRDGSAS